MARGEVPGSGFGPISRRTLLWSAAAAGAVVGGTVLSARTGDPTITTLKRLAGFDNGPAKPGAVRIEKVRSRARNRVVDMVTMYPTPDPEPDLPVCLLLHGRFGSARLASFGKLPKVLSTLVHNELVPPFALVALDGGPNSYWHRYRPDDDPMEMLLEEFPEWMHERQLGDGNGTPFAITGVSMGGFGALVYARRRLEANNPLKAAAVVSPALMTSWNEMKTRNAFADQAAWSALDPLRHIDKLGKLPLGVWCGTEDRFITGTRQFIKAARPQVASTSPGGHNDIYYTHAAPEVVDFLGRYVP
ncbi:alpha/beta hydrolase [Pseudonocardiaceae bacterium YIM PH 21723]|nr:alpha/beta hydrolase [Pseudonocardiaceae bacterium YIM PH 21723]